MSVRPFPSRQRRIALYSHDTLGLGHLRRNLRLADVFAADGRTDVLLVSGARELGRFPLPPSTDAVVVPGISKSPLGDYGPRALRWSLAEIVRLRAEIIRSSLLAFSPDALVVDKVPLGLAGELAPTLTALRGAGTRVVLGLRDILDDPPSARRDWERDGATAVIERFYDEVWVYGDPVVHDLPSSVGFPASVAARSKHTGYLCGVRSAGSHRASRAGDGALVLCLVGGGQDGAALLEAFLHCQLPPGSTGLAVAGPYLPPRELQRLRAIAAASPDRAIRSFTDDVEPLIDRADRVIAMAGYNTVCELLSRSVPVLYVPRVRPRREQLVRAARLAELGWCDVLHPDLLAPSRLSTWLGAPARPVHARTPIDVDGLRRVRASLDDLLDAPARGDAFVLQEAQLVLD